METTELEALIALTTIPNLGAVSIRALILRYGSAVDALKAVGFFRKQDARCKRILELAKRYNVHMIPYTSPDYPKFLLATSDYPVLLYVKGTLLPKDKRSIAVVGTRQPTPYGIKMAKEISQELAKAGFTVVSGLALGIDTAAHQGALASGRTVGVIGSGLAHLYPQENAFLANAITHSGAIISEFPMDALPNRETFPQRNRIVSGMTLGTVLIEAPVKSGSLITIDKAFKQQRPVFVLPGRADSPASQGNHWLLKNGQGYFMDNAQDVITYFENLFSLPAIPQSDSRINERSLVGERNG